MASNSDLKYNNRSLKFSKAQVELTKELAKKHGVTVDDIIHLQTEFGKFINTRIESNFEVIFFAQFGKFIPTLQKKVGHKFENIAENGNTDNNLPGGEEEKS